jgi:flagellar capping protein FliD
MVEPDNIVLVHLRDLRADMNARFDAIENRFESRFEAIEKRLDMMHANGMKALKSFIGHRTMTERAMASFDDEVTRLRRRVDADIADLKQRIEQLEARP